MPRHHDAGCLQRQPRNTGICTCGMSDAQYTASCKTWGVTPQVEDDRREVQRLTQIIMDAMQALDHLDGVVALETWDDDHIPPAVRGAALAVRFRLERVYPDFKRGGDA